MNIEELINKEKIQHFGAFFGLTFLNKDIFSTLRK